MITRGFTNNTIITRGFASSGIVVVIKYIYAKTSLFINEAIKSNFVKQSGIYGNAFMQIAENIITRIAGKNIIISDNMKDVVFAVDSIIDAGWIYSTSPYQYIPSLDFSDESNSQYIGII